MLKGLEEIFVWSYAGGWIGEEWALPIVLGGVLFAAVLRQQCVYAFSLILVPALLIVYPPAQAVSLSLLLELLLLFTTSGILRKTAWRPAIILSLSASFLVVPSFYALIMLPDWAQSLFVLIILNAVSFALLKSRLKVTEIQYDLKEHLSLRAVITGFCGVTAGLLTPVLSYRSTLFDSQEKGKGFAFLFMVLILFLLPIGVLFVLPHSVDDLLIMAVPALFPLALFAHLIAAFFAKKLESKNLAFLIFLSGFAFSLAAVARVLVAGVPRGVI